MKRYGKPMLVLLALLLVASACGQQGEEPPAHTHTWDAANCLRGELCWSCKETRGEALGHDWVDATCQKAKHCSRCGKSEGNLISHTKDGQGNCTVCKQELNVYAVLDGASPETGFVVYDGAVLRFPYDHRPDRYDNAGTFGKEYWIYDQTDTLVAQGTWPQKPPEAIKTETGYYFVNYHDTEYIPLDPGNYRVEYSYYKTWKSTTDVQGLVYPWDCYLVPTSELLRSSNKLEVR